MLYNLEESAFGESQDTLRLNEIFSEIESVKIDSMDQNIIVVEHKPLRSNLPIQKDFSNTIVYEMDKDKFGLPYKKPIFNFGIRNVGNGDSLVGIFLAIKERFRASKFVIFIYDHSNSIGHLSSSIVVDKIFNLINVSVQSSKIEVDTGKLNIRFKASDITNNNNVNDKSVRQFIRKVIPQFGDSNHDMLTNAELADAMLKAFSLNPVDDRKEREKVEAIFFDTCYTAAIENLYLYSKCANYIVASEGEIHFNSFKIAKIIDEFSKEKDTEIVLNSILENFEEDFVQLHPTDNTHKRMMVHAFNLKKFDADEFKKVFNKMLLNFFRDIEFITDALLKKQSNPHELLLDCYSIYNEEPPDFLRQEFYTHTYDFFLLFKYLENEAKQAERSYASEIRDVRSYVEAVVLKNNFIGSDINLSSFSGLSIYLNRRVNRLDEKRRAQIENSYSFYSRSKNDFARNTLWPEFIQLYEKTSAR